MTIAIVIADGGSTDNTLDIARKYGCKIISQSDPGEPIRDFAKERNRMVNVSSNDWFFWLDSDEYVTDELCDEIKRISICDDPKHLFYNIRIQRVSADCTIHYKDLRPNFQIRLFNKKSGALFHKKVHEKLRFNRDQYTVGTVYAAWCVPVTKTSFNIYKKTVDYRLPLMVEDWTPSGFKEYIIKGVFKPIKGIAVQLAKIILLRLKYRSSEILPLRYEFFRIYSKLILMREMTKKYLHSCKTR